jgi:hypothetical protein
MKTTFLEYITSNALMPNFNPIEKNILECIDNETFLFRGSDTFSNFGEKEERQNRTSLTTSNLFLNFSSIYFPDFPNRRKSFFATNFYSNAQQFGDDVFVLIPHDNVSKFAIMKGDFNLVRVYCLREFDTGLDSINLSDFVFTFADMPSRIISEMDEGGFLFAYRTEALVEKLKKLVDCLNKISFGPNEDVSKSDFEKLNSLFFEAFGSQDFEKLRSEKDDFRFLSLAFGLFDAIKSGKVKDLTDIFKMMVEEATKTIEIHSSFKDLIKSLKNKNNKNDGFSDYEIWFQGKCSYFKIEWLKDLLLDANVEEIGSRLSNFEIATALTIAMHKE